MTLYYKHILKVNFQIELHHPTPLEEAEAIAVFKEGLPQLVEDDPYFVDDMNVSLYWTLPQGTKEELNELLG
jgi:hypothetical protein